MLYVGLDLSRKRLDVHVVDEGMVTVAVTGVLPDRDGLRSLVDRLAGRGEPVRAAIESMTGARFIHDELERLGWDVEIADAQRVKGLAPLCLQDRQDRRPRPGRAQLPRLGPGDLAADAGGACGA
jgi:hypothetical protein